MKCVKNVAFNKKGSNSVFPFMLTAGLSLIVLFIALTVGADIMQGVQQNQNSTETAYNVSRDSLNLLAKVSDQGSNIGLIVGLGFVLLVLVTMFGAIAINRLGGGRM